jgi:hypothetical protein
MLRRPFSREHALLAAIALACHDACLAPERTQRRRTLDWPALEEEAVRVLHEVSAARHEQPARQRAPRADFFAELFERDGIAVADLRVGARTREHRRAARGQRSKPGIVLMHHMDVVPADASYWKAPPFGGEIRGGARGDAVRSTTRAWASRARPRCSRCAVERAALAGDVIFLGVADEEAGGAAGAGFMVAEHFDLFANAGVVLNEGGYIATDAQRAGPVLRGGDRAEGAAVAAPHRHGEPGPRLDAAHGLGAEPAARRAGADPGLGDAACASCPSCSASTPTPRHSRRGAARTPARPARRARPTRSSRPSSPRTRARTRRCATRSR